MKTIFHVAPNINVKGGISTVLKMYLKTEMPNHYDVKFITSHRDGTKLYKVAVMLLGLVKFLFLMVTNPADIVHIHCGDIPSPYRKYIFFKISLLFKSRIILHWHGGNFLQQIKKVSAFWRNRLFDLFGNVDCVICLSQSWSDELGAIFPESRRLVIFNGITLPNERKDSKYCDKAITRIVFLGLLIDKKGIFDLISAVEKLLNEGFKIKLYLGGSGDIAKLQNRISKSFLDKSIYFLGWINERQKDLLLSTGDIFVLPSYGEAMPMSILEAMSYGLSVISTYVGSIPELIQDGVNGYLIEPGDVETLYQKLKALVLDPELRMQMGSNGRLIIEERYNIEKSYRILNQLYSDLLLKKIKNEYH
jgi:glycosyltransferase involved in cell wall biosynthesis